mmetsp:Transcript_40556/g.67180  ORF Transcript_40556/g.67180 Transcript_40556/m.67180 type:complete len:113 (-) Transcript_40556:110-448(-)
MFKNHVRPSVESQLIDHKTLRRAWLSMDGITMSTFHQMIFNLLNPMRTARAKTLQPAGTARTARIVQSASFTMRTKPRLQPALQRPGAWNRKNLASLLQTNLVNAGKDTTTK